MALPLAISPHGNRARMTGEAVAGLSGTRYEKQRRCAKGAPLTYLIFREKLIISPAR